MKPNRACRSSQGAIQRPAVTETLIDGALGYSCDLGPFRHGPSMAVEAHVSDVSWHQGSGERTMNRPSALQSFQQYQAVDTVFGRPVSQGLTSAVVFYETVAARVSRLLGLCSPVAIARLVSAVVVSPLDRVFLGWSQSHVSHERGKVVSPLVANLNTPPAIVFVGFCLCVVAPLIDAHPRLILGASMPVNGMPVSPRPGSSQRITYATATLTSPVLKIAGKNSDLSSTHAAAQPVPLVVGDIGQSFDGPIVEDAAGKILGYPHTSIVSRSNY